MLCPSLSALQAACPALAYRTPLRFAHSILSFANSDVEYLLGKLNGIARTFGHEMSMPHAAP